jgi:hypothetical protein
MPTHLDHHIPYDAPPRRALGPHRRMSVPLILSVVLAILLVTLLVRDYAW